MDIYSVKQMIVSSVQWAKLEKVHFSLDYLNISIYLSLFCLKNISLPYLYYFQKMISIFYFILDKS